MEGRMGRDDQADGIGRLRAVGLRGEAAPARQGRALSSSRRSSGSTATSSASPTASRRTVSSRSRRSVRAHQARNLTLGYGQDEIKVGID